MFEFFSDLSSLIRLFSSLNKQQRKDILRFAETYQETRD